MKPLLTLLLILFCFNVYGQKDTTKIPISSLCCPVSTASLDNGFYKIWEWKATTTLDTIPILMLYCDTVRSEWVDSAIVNGKLVQVGEKRINYPARGVHWDFGYEVLSPVYNAWNEVAYKQHVSYLDRNKQPLRKSIVVWMVKGTK